MSGAERQARRILAEAGVAAIVEMRAQVATLEARLAEVERERDEARAKAADARDEAETERKLSDRYHARLTTLQQAAGDFCETVEHAAACIEARGRGGQQVSFHGDFASAPPSTMGRLQWWARTLRAAMGEEVRDG